jgi:c-di-GMP phosphodiesterase
MSSSYDPVFGEVSMDFMLNRQPVFKGEIQLAGYEFQSSVAQDSFGSEAAVDADRSMFSMLHTGLDEVLGPHSCFLAPTREAFVERVWEGAPLNRAVLGYYKDFAVSDDIAQQLLRIGNSGVRFAVSAHLDSDSMYVLGNRAHAIKVDVTRVPFNELEKHVQSLRRYKALIIADGIDTYDDFEFCKTINFDLYQGRFIARSASKEDKEVAVNRLTMMRVLSQLQNPDLSMEEMDKTIALDAALTSKLLSLVNSEAVAICQTVSSLSHALRIVGLQRIRTWASVLLISSIDNKPRELMNLALIRARMCERLAESIPGLLSVVEALLDCSMEKAVGKLPLIDEVKSALIGRTGLVGEALNCAIAYEQSDWEKVQFSTLPAAMIRETYLDSLAWAGKLSSGLTT